MSLRRFQRDLDRLGQLADAMNRPSSGSIEMIEIAPGVFTRKEPRRPPAPSSSPRVVRQLQELADAGQRVRQGFAGIASSVQRGVRR